MSGLKSPPPSIIVVVASHSADRFAQCHALAARGDEREAENGRENTHREREQGQGGEVGREGTAETRKEGKDK